MPETTTGSMLIWAKTDAGRAEMQARSLVKDRARRNLLLIVDGKTTAEKLLSGLAGVSGDDFKALEALGLIEPVAAPAQPAPRPAPPVSIESVDIDVSGHDFAHLRSAIARMISKEIGLRGFTLSLLLEEAVTVTDLKEVAQRLFKQIGERKGAAAEAEARRSLLGG